MIRMGERYVGENRARERAQAAYKRRDGRPFDTFEDEDHLFQSWLDMNAAEARDVERRLALRRYIHFHATRRREEIARHRRRAHFDPCPSCGNCRCDCRDQVYRCLCGEGKKILGPNRWVFMNGSAKRDWLTRIWQVGVGSVPRGDSPDHFSIRARDLDDILA